MQQLYSLLNTGWGPTACLSLLIAISVSFIFMPLLWRRPKSRLSGGAHVLITGGSKGLGLELARECARRGCSVTIVARNQADLDSALQQLQAEARAGKGAAAVAEAATVGRPPRLLALSADTGDQARLKKAFEEAEQNAGPVDVLICNAGAAEPGLFVEQPSELFERQMRVNYLGSVHSIKAALPGMLQRSSGHIVVVTSALAVVGYAGYSAYAATKWALRGMCDCLRNELQGTGVNISVAYPPDMDTPGYEEENKTKPGVCHAVEDSLGTSVIAPDKVARKMVAGIESGAYHLQSPDLLQDLLISVMTSISPKRFLLLVHVLLGPILPIVSSAFCWIVDKAAHKYNRAHGMPPRAAAGDAAGAGR